jgi:hypothetical protein
VTVAPESGIEPFGNDDSVTQCLAIMNEIANEQRGRNRHLDTKAGSIAGYRAKSANSSHETGVRARPDGQA